MNNIFTKQPIGKSRAMQSFKSISSIVFRYIIIILGAIFILLPFYWMINTSLKSPGDIYAYPPDFFPTAPTLNNYKEALTSLPFVKFFLNTTIVTVFVILGQMLICILAAFAFAKLQFPLKTTIFALFLSTLMIPDIILIIPNFILIKTIGWIDTLRALIIPGIFIGSAFGVFLLRQFFSTIPDSLSESALIDGCSVPQIIFLIIVPNSKPALTSLGIFILVKIWNDFMWPLTVINSTKKNTLAIGIMSFQGLIVKNWGVIMAGAMLTVLPLILLYLFAQRFFIEGITLTGIK